MPIRIKELGPIVRAINSLRNSLYQAPQTTIEGIDNNQWPNPLQPITPMGPVGAEPLQWQMDWGRNLIYTQRDDAEYSAAALRRLATYPIARICIGNTKDVLAKMPWRIQLKPVPGENRQIRGEKAKKDPNIIKLNHFFERPNPREDWDEFIRPVLDDMLVIDAGSVFLGRSKKDFSISELRWIEGSSITRMVDIHGWTPLPPSVAYQQTYQGYPRIDLTTQQLVYRPRNIVPRNFQSSFLYGMSPTEDVAKEIEIGFARLQFVYDFYSSGTIPGAVLFAPVGTPPTKIKEAQDFIDSDLAGNLAKRRRLQIFQGFQADGKNEQVWQPKEALLADAFDELHIRKICFAFGTSPMRLMRMMNRGSSQTIQEASEEEGTLPFLDWLKHLMNSILQLQMGYTDYEFAFDPFVETDVKKLAEADEIDIKCGLYSRNEKREARGDDPREEAEADELTVVTSTGVIPLTMSKQIADAEIQSRKNKPQGKSPIQSTSTTKTNGHTSLIGCDRHKESYPRLACSACREAELARFNEVKKKEEYYANNG